MIERAPTSISRQLLKDLLIPLCSAFVISTAVAYTLAAWFANEASDHELLNAAHAVAARLTQDGDGLVAELPHAVQEVLRHNDRDKFFYQVLNTQHERLAGDALLPMPISNTNTDVPRFRDTKVEGMDVRMVRIRVPLHGGGGRLVLVQAARTLNARRELIGKIFLSIVIPQIILGALSVAAVWLGVRRGLQPLHKLGSDIQQRSQFDLAPIEAENTPREILPIVGALNSLLEQLDNHVSAQQRFVANAAHQLRTPVAGLKAYIELGRRNKSGITNDVLDQLDAGTNRISDMVAGLLVLARAGDNRVKRKESVDLNVVASDVTSTMARQANDNKIKLILTLADDDAIVYGDATELRELLSNLIDNAIRYNSPGGKVEIKVNSGPPQALVVLDDGPGIPSDQKERVFERFYRVLGTRVNGSGLGLAIVREIARTHDATVSLEDPPEGSGTVLRVTFSEEVKQAGPASTPSHELAEAAMRSWPAPQT